jgi:hypothetical protein
MALTPDLEIVVDELVVDGVDPDDPLVEEAVARELAPALAAYGHAKAAGPVAAAVAREISS